MFPGRLSVSRTIGDSEAKNPKVGGNPKVISAEPEIITHSISDKEDDCLLLACDGVFDRLSNREMMDAFWAGVNDPPLILNSHKPKTYHEALGEGIDTVIK